MARGSGLLLPVALLALAWIGFAPALGAWWTADDLVVVHGQARAPGLAAALGLHEAAPFLRPVLGASLWLDYLVYGHDPHAYRWHGLALHVLCAWALGVAVQRATGSRGAGWTAALLFVSSPLHAEAVCWISARGYALAGCLAVLAWLLVHPAQARPRWLPLLALCVAGALLSIEAALPLPFVIAVLAWRRGTPPPARSLAVSAAVLAVYFGVRLWYLGGIGGYGGGDRHLQLAPLQVAAYLVRAAAHVLAPGLWDGEARQPFGIAGAALAWPGQLALFAMAVRAVGWRGAARFALAWALALSVVAGWATLSPDLLGSRYLYLPQLVVAAGLAVAAARGSRPAAVAALVAVLVAAQTCALREAAARWGRAGELARRAVDELVQVATEQGWSTIWVYGRPLRVGGAYALPWGDDLVAAVAVFGDPEWRVQRVESDAEWEQVLAARAGLPPALRATQGALRWDAVAGRWQRP